MIKSVADVDSFFHNNDQALSLFPSIIAFRLPFVNLTPEARLPNLRCIFYLIMPQPIFSPAFPDGCVLKSSGILWIMTLLPMISDIRNRLS